MQIWAKEYICFRVGGVYSVWTFARYTGVAAHHQKKTKADVLLCKLHPPSTPSNVKQTSPKLNCNPGSGAVVAAYKDTEMIIRET